MCRHTWERAAAWRLHSSEREESWRGSVIPCRAATHRDAETICTNIILRDYNMETLCLGLLPWWNISKHKTKVLNHNFHLNQKYSICFVSIVASWIDDKLHATKIPQVMILSLFPKNHNRLGATKIYVSGRNCTGDCCANYKQCASRYICILLKSLLINFALSPLTTHTTEFI